MMFHSEKEADIKSLPCVSTVLDNLEVKGQRHKLVIALHGWLSWNTKLSQSEIKELILSRINENDRREFSEFIDGLTSPYFYSCESRLFKSLCRESCILKRNPEKEKLFKKLDALFLEGEWLKEYSFMGFKFRKTDLVGLVGDPGSGKSIFALNFAAFCIEHGMSVVYLNLDQDDRLLAKRAAGLITGLTEEEFKDNKEFIAESLKRFSETFMVSSENEFDGIIKAVKTSAADVLIVDHVGNLKAKGSQYEKMKTIAEFLKDTAKEYKMIVLAISHIRKSDSAPHLHSARDANLAEASDLFLGLKNYGETITVTSFKVRDGLKSSSLIAADWRRSRLVLKESRHV